MTMHTKKSHKQRSRDYFLLPVVRYLDPETNTILNNDTHGDPQNADQPRLTNGLYSERVMLTTDRITFTTSVRYSQSNVR